MRELFENLYAHCWVVIHHRWIALSGCIVIAIIGWIIVGFIPDKYEVEAKVFFDTRTVLKPLLQGLAVDSDIRQQSAMIVRKTFLTRANLTKVINETDLALEITDSRDMELLQIKLLKGITIKTDNISGRKRSGSNIYRIMFKHTDPKMAKRVVESLLNIFVETILGANRKDSNKAEGFLDDQIKSYANKLEQAEERLKLFKQDNAGMMPEEGTSYFSRLNALKTKMADAKLQLNEKINQSATLKQQIQNLLDKSSDASEQAINLVPDPMEIRIEAMQTRLDELLLQYTNRHPDVISTKAALGTLRIRKSEQEHGQSTNGSDNHSRIMSSKLYQDLNVMQSQAEAEIAALRTRVDEYNKRVVAMNSLINAIPEVEAELKRLNRDYTIVKDTYDQLVQRRASAQISREADQTASESQFNIIEPPTIPLNPVSPNRVMLITFVLILGITGGIGLTILVDQMRPAFYTRKQIEEFINIPVLGSVSMYWTDKELKKRRFDMLVYSLISFLLICAYIVVLVKQDLFFDLENLMR